MVEVETIGLRLEKKEQEFNELRDSLKSGKIT